MNSYETRERRAFAPQQPYRAPWLAICLFAALVAFLAGHLLWPTADDKQSNVVDALHDPPSELKDNSLNTKKTAGLPLFGLPGTNPVADIVSSVGPSVVSIDTTIRERRRSVSIPDLLFSKPGKQRDSESYEAHGAGSGIIVRSDGYIMTNYHVVKSAQEIKVTLTDGRVYKGSLVGRDTYTDVAMVKVNAFDLPVAKLGTSRGVRPGDWAIAIGSPLGLSHTVTMGIVSAVGRSLADLNNNVDLIQTDAAINPGNSGGPLLNIKGEVVGINMAIRTDAQNIGFTIPIDIAREAASAIMQHKALSRPYLGLTMVDVDSKLAEAMGIPDGRQGALVSKVVTAGPAAASGITEGDLIESVDDTPVKDGNDVQRVVRMHKVGNELRMQVFHAGKLRNISVRLTAYPENDTEAGSS